MQVVGRQLTGLLPASIAPIIHSVHSQTFGTKSEDTRLSIGYLRSHWAGRQPLAWSFWVNFALLCTAINLIEPFIRPSAPDRSWLSFAAAVAYLIIGHMLIYPWQVIGLLRACNQHLKGSSDSVIITAAQGAIVVSLIAGLMTMTSTLQSLLATPQKTVLERANFDVEARIPGYKTELIEGQGLIRIDGEFDIGLTRDLETLLAREPEVRGIVLNSDGGRIYEARGVARLIGEHRLATYVYHTCQSACTTAFIAGSMRYLGEQGRLGFHQYRLKAIHPLINIVDEQEKDRAFYQSQGIAPDLLARIFATPHDRMWYPDPGELISANVVHQLIQHRAM